MGTTLMGVDIVGIRIEIFGVLIGVLHRHIDHNILFDIFKEDDFFMDDVFITIEVGHVLFYPIFMVIDFFFLATLTFVC